MQLNPKWLPGLFLPPFTSLSHLAWKARYLHFLSFENNPLPAMSSQPFPPSPEALVSGHQFASTGAHSDDKGCTSDRFCAATARFRWVGRWTESHQSLYLQRLGYFPGMAKASPCLYHVFAMVHELLTTCDVCN